MNYATYRLTLFDVNSKYKAHTYTTNEEFTKVALYYSI